MISPYRVMWQGLSSLDFDLWAEIAFDSEQGDTSSFLNRQSVSTEHYDGSYRRMHSYKYSEVLMPQITFIKQDYSEFTFEENRKILSWLTSNQTPEYLEIYHDDSNVMSYQLFGAFTEISQHKLANGRVIGYVVTFESSTPYAWSQKFEVTRSINEVDDIKITCDSDEYNKLLYPKMTVKFTGGNIYLIADKDPLDTPYDMIPDTLYQFEDKLYININSGDDEGKHQISGELSKDTKPDTFLGGGYYYFSHDNSIKKVIEIKNNNDESVPSWKIVTIVGYAVKITNTYLLNNESTTKTTTIAGGALDETIIFDGTNKVVASSKTAKSIGNSFNWEWPVFIAGENTINVVGNCDIKFEWVEPRKVGSL